MREGIATKCDYDLRGFLLPPLAWSVFRPWTMSAISATPSSEPSVRLRVSRALCSRMPPLVAQRMRDRIYPRSAAELDSYRFTVRSQTGSPFTGTTSDLVAYPMAVHGYFNWRNIAIARAVCQEGDVIVEIGANIGSETVSFSDIVGQTGTVHAFEPFTPNLEQLRLNAAQTRHPNVNIFPVALSDHDGDVRFAAPRPHNSGSGHLVGAAEDDTFERQTTGDVIEVRCATLDSLLAQLGHPRLVVVDAEGHDAAILRGANRLLTVHQPVVVLEVVEDLLARSGASPEELSRQLRSLGYNLFEITRFRVVPVEVEARRGPTRSDWVAVPQSSGRVTGTIRRTIRRCGLTPLLPGVNPLRG
jgi:FkbM family methyltransferase